MIVNLSMTKMSDGISQVLRSIHVFVSKFKSYDELYFFVDYLKLLFEVEPNLSSQPREILRI